MFFKAPASNSRPALSERSQYFQLTPDHLRKLEANEVYEDLFVDNLKSAMNVPQTSDLTQRGIIRHNDQVAEQLSVSFAHPALYSQGADYLCALTHIALADRSPFREADMTERERQILANVRHAVGEFKMEPPQVAATAKHLSYVLNAAREVGERRDREYGTDFFLDKNGGFRFDDIRLPKEMHALLDQNQPSKDASWVAEKINGRLTATLVAKPKTSDIFKGALEMANDCGAPEEKIGAFLGFMMANAARLAIGRPYTESISHDEAVTLLSQNSLASTLPRTTSLKSREDVEGAAAPPAPEPGHRDVAAPHSSAEVAIPTPPPAVPTAVNRDEYRESADPVSSTAEPFSREEDECTPVAEAPASGIRLPSERAAAPRIVPRELDISEERRDGVVVDTGEHEADPEPSSEELFSGDRGHGSEVRRNVIPGLEVAERMGDGHSGGRGRGESAKVRKSSAADGALPKV